MSIFYFLVNTSHTILENKKLEYQISKRLISKVFEEESNNMFETTYFRCAILKKMLKMKK